MNNPLSQHELFQSITKTFADCIAIVEKKNSDYATGDDAFKNFRFASLVGVEPKRAILVRMADKLARISNVMDGTNQVVDEKTVDTLNDLINYAAILKAWIEADSNPVVENPITE